MKRPESTNYASDYAFYRALDKYHLDKARREDRNFLIRLVAGILAAFMLLIGLPMWLVPVGDKAACERVANHTGYTTKYEGGTYWTRACFIQDDGRWVPLDKWIGVDQT